jgi:EpsI family protein
MSSNTPIRLYAVAGIIAVTFGVAYFIQANVLKPPEVKMPQWTFGDMPLQLGDWRGENTESDPLITGRTGAKTTVERNYRDEAGHQIAVYTAMWEDVAEGVYHNPMNCYFSQGFRQSGKQVTKQLRISDQLSIPVNLSKWEKDSPHGGKDQVIVIYWYQLGEHILFGRWDLGWKVRWALAGRPNWPPLIKVMMQISASDADEAESLIMDLAERVAKWENQPDHRKDWETSAPASLARASAVSP